MGSVDGVADGLLERLRLLLAGQCVWDAELGYELEGAHVGVIASGVGARELLRMVAVELGCMLLCVPAEEGMVWAWLGGRERFPVGEVERVVASAAVGDRAVAGGGVVLAVGEPGWGLEGWRLTHRQARAALVVALRRPRRWTRYADVALLAMALKDELLAGALVDIYVAPLDDARGGGVVLRQTLRAYLTTERNASSAAAALGVARSTVEKRLGTIEERLGRPLQTAPAELEIALQLDELGIAMFADDSSSETGGDVSPLFAARCLG